MKKFDLLEKKRQLEGRKKKTKQKETLGTRLTKVFVGSIAAFMFWSVFSTLKLSKLFAYSLNALIVIGFFLYLWKSGVFNKNHS